MNMVTSPTIFHELKKQASFFFKEKINSARLVLTDVTPTQILAEDATNETPSSPDTRTLGVISRAAFEVDDYWRIVQILHNRLVNFEGKNWRRSYKALVLLEHMLTHGPLRLAEEFQCDINVIKDMTIFHYIDHNGFDWGSSIRKLSERVSKLIQNEEFLKEERAKSRQVSRGIEGFGSFNHLSSRCLDESIKSFNGKSVQPKQEIITNNETHPFFNNQHEIKASLLSIS